MHKNTAIGGVAYGGFGNRSRRFPALNFAQYKWRLVIGGDGPRRLTILRIWTDYRQVF